MRIWCARTSVIFIVVFPFCERAARRSEESGRWTRAIASPSLRGALATKQSRPLAGPWIASLALAMTRRAYPVRPLRALLARHHRSEPLPGLTLKAHHLQLLERCEVGRAGLDPRSRQIDADLEAQIGGLFH